MFEGLLEMEYQPIHTNNISWLYGAGNVSIYYDIPV